MSPRSLVLQLLTAASPLHTSSLLRAGSVFGVAPGTIRVALTRLAAAGQIEHHARGMWRLGPTTAPVAGHVGAWRSGPARVRAWEGSWIGVATGALPRVERSAVRRRDRALSLLGFRSWRPGLEVRPDNLAAEVDGVRRQLAEIGLDEGAPVFAVRSLSEADLAEVCALWDGAALDAACVQARRELQRVADELEALSPEESARRSFLVGSAALRVLAFDPLLPAPIVDPELRWALVHEMAWFDRLGRRAWQRILEEVTV